MAYAAVNFILEQSVPSGSSISVPYPPGKNEASFFSAMNHNATIESNFYRCPRDFIIDTQPDRIVFTWRGSFTIPAGTLINLQLEEPCGDFYRDLRNGITVLNMCHSQLFLINLSTPEKPHPEYIVKSNAITATKSLPLVNQWLSVARNLTIHSQDDNAHCSFTIEGEDLYGRPMVESIRGPASGVSAGKKSFTRILRVTPSHPCNGMISIGTGDRLGLPVFLPGPAFVMREIVNGEEVKGGMIVRGETDMVSTATTGDRRGTYTPPQGVEMNGRNTIQLLVSLPNPSNIGSTDYAG